MKPTRRDTLKVLGAASALAAATKAQAAPPARPPEPIATSGGTRLYPTWASPRWWSDQKIANGTWTLPADPSLPPMELVSGGYSSLGASAVPDGATGIQDVRNTPRHGVFTRAYLQLVTPPLQGPQTLNGTVSMAIHCVEWHRRINAVLALQVAVHRSDGALRALALPVSTDTNEFTLGTPARTRAIVGLPLTEVGCQDGDTLAINIGIWANNESRTLAQGVGFYVYASQTGPIAYIDTDALGNTWVEFSAPLTFQPLPVVA
jgi:hypothetical protein